MTYFAHVSSIAYTSAINVFSCQYPITKIDANGAEETWIYKTYFSTEETFPTVLKRSEVIDIQTIEISPIESALNDVEHKTKELNAMNTKYSAIIKTGQIISTNALSKVLNSVVDAPINGSVSQYRKVFLVPEYLEKNPERIEQVQRLRDNIDEQVFIRMSCYL